MDMTEILNQKFRVQAASCKRQATSCKLQAARSRPDSMPRLSAYVSVDRRKEQAAGCKVKTCQSAVPFGSW